MRFWREITADRFSGGLLGLLLALSFAFQTLAAGSAAAAMVVPGPAHALCTSWAEDVDAPPASDHRHECPCSDLCGAGVLLQTSLGPSDGVGLPIRFADRIEVAPDRPQAVGAAPATRPYRATGPPVPA